MVHPTRLLRSTSDEGASQFSAPLDLVGQNPVDCGIAKLPCLNRWINLEKFATPRVFLVLIAFAGVLQGSSLSYFRGTSWIWTQYFHFDAVVVDWLLYVNEIFTGICALVIGYYGNKIHRASWFGGLVIYQSIAALILFAPEVHRPFTYAPANASDTSNLCALPGMLRLISLENTIVPLLTLFVYQLMFSFVTISFLCHGLTYLDDNVGTAVSPAYIAVAFSSKEMGKHFGMYLAWLPHWNGAAVFLSPVWIVLTSLTFVIGVGIAMFPRSLPSVLMQNAVVSILDVAQGVDRSRDTDNGADKAFWSTFYRLLKNRLLLINIFASVFMYSAVINFEIFESFYYQSKFLVPTSADVSKFDDTWLSQMIVSLLKQPFIAVCLVTSGVIIAKAKPSARSVAIWNAAVLTVVIILFVPHAFLGCQESVQSEFDGKLQFFCNYRCDCEDQNRFAPVCSEIGQKTYYSPCHAGCSSVQTVNDVKLYSNCTCGENIHAIVNTYATEGSCNSNTCFVFWSLAQVTLVICSGLLATTVVPSTMINLRCVLLSDKALALALEFTFVASIPFVPFKLIYGIVADYLCQYYHNGQCKLHSSHFGTFVSVATITLIAVSAILTLVVVRLSTDLELYKIGNKRNYDEDDVAEHELKERHRSVTSLRQSETENPDATEVVIETEPRAAETPTTENERKQVVQTDF